MGSKMKTLTDSVKEAEDFLASCTRDLLQDFEKTSTMEVSDEKGIDLIFSNCKDLSDKLSTLIEKNPHLEKIEVPSEVMQIIDAGNNPDIFMKDMILTTESRNRFLSKYLTGTEKLLSDLKEDDE